MTDDSPISAILGPKPKLVVVDTFVIRDLMHVSDGKLPKWYSTFVKARTAGFIFCISHFTFLELLTQIKEGRIEKRNFLDGIQLAEAFISPNLPVFYESKAMLFLAGIIPKYTESPVQVATAGRKLWSILKDIQALTLLSKEPVGASIEQVREDHCKNILQMKKFKGQVIGVKRAKKDTLAILKAELDIADSNLDRLSPLVDMAFHFVEAAMNTSYNESSKSTKNDGIDRWLTFALVLPGFLITEKKWMNIARAKCVSPWRDRVLTPDEFSKLYEENGLSNLWD